MPDLPPETRIRKASLGEALWLLWRRITRRRVSGCICPRCAYPTHGLSRTQCPECGSELTVTGVLSPTGDVDYLREFPLRRVWLARLGIVVIVLLLIYVATPWLTAKFAVWEHATASQSVSFTSGGNLGVGFTAKTVDFTSRPWHRYPKRINVIELEIGNRWRTSLPKPPRRQLSTGEMFARDVRFDPNRQVIYVYLHEWRPSGFYTTQPKGETRELPLNHKNIMTVLKYAEFDTSDPQLISDGQDLVRMLKHMRNLSLPEFRDDMMQHMRQAHPTWRWSSYSQGPPYVRGSASYWTRWLPTLFNTIWIMLGIGAWWWHRRRVQRSIVQVPIPQR